MTTMLNPFLKLGGINDNILSIMNYLDELEDKNFSLRLTELYRKSFIMQLLSDKYIIAVTGIQGVGKTTLLKKLYSVDEDILLTNQGRGEQLPILFTETKADEKSAYIYRIERRDSSLIIERDQIDKHDVNLLSSAYNRQTDLFIEIEVKEAVFGCDTKHFLLLPGIESKDSYMYDLTWSALRTAANCIIVMFANAYAKEENRKLVEKLKQEFKNSEPLFVLSMADQTSDKNEELKKTVINDLSIEREDRVIITGISDDLISVWPHQFKKAVQRYSASSTESISVKCKNMKNLLDDVKDLRSDIKTFIENANIVNELDELKVEKYLSHFSAEFKRIRNDIAEGFSSHMNEFENLMNKSIQSKIQKKSWGKEILDKIFTREITSLIEFQEMIDGCLEEASKCHYIEKGFMESLARSQIKYLYPTENTPYDDSIDELSKALVYTKDDQGITTDDQILIQDIQHLYYPSKYKDVPKISETMEFSLRTIPHLFNELLRINYLIPDAYTNKYDEKYEIMPHSKDSIKQILQIYSENKPTLANAIGAIIGFDMAMDGQLDLFNLIESIIPQATSKLTESLTAYLGLAMIVFNAFDYLNNVVNRTQIKKLEVAGSIVSDLRKHIESQFMLNYDKSVRVFTEYTVDMIRLKLGLTKRLSTFWNLEQSLLNLKDISKEIKEELDVVPF